MSINDDKLSSQYMRMATEWAPWATNLIMESVTIKNQRHGQENMTLGAIPLMRKVQSMNSHTNVDVYYNVTRETYSVKGSRGAMRGRVVAHSPKVILRDVEFVVSQAGTGSRSYGIG